MPSPIPFSPRNGQPCLITIAGPNGIGKSTFYERHLVHLGWPYVNADALARAFWSDHLSEENNRRHRDLAAAVMTDKLRELLIRDPELRQKCHSYLSETVFSSARKRDLLVQAREAGYRVILFVLGTDVPALLCARVSQRKVEGLHGVDPGDVIARYPKVFENAAAAVPIAHEIRLIDNSDVDNPFREVASIVDGTRTEMVDVLPTWARTVLAGSASST